MKRLVVAWLVALAPSVRANPRPLPFTYPSESLAKGEFELEQFVDLSPVRTLDLTAAKVWTLRYVLTSEFEYGITRRLELGFYLLASNTPDGSGGAPFSFDGVKQRLRYRLREPGEWPVDVAFYLELAELRNELELEAKVILQRRFGPVRIMVNLWAEREFYYDGRGEWVLDPTAGATVQVHPRLHIGLEYWVRGELGAPPTTNPVAQFNADFHHFLGPALMVQLGRFWWSTAAYLRLDGIHRTSGIGEAYGHIWVRTVLGVEL